MVLKVCLRLYPYTHLLSLGKQLGNPILCKYTKVSNEYQCLWKAKHNGFFDITEFLSLETNLGFMWFNKEHISRFLPLG